MPSASQLIRAYARRYGVDPRAALAVARGEGGLRNRPGDIGDLAGGGSYGPFQLYAQGALPSRFRGRPGRADAWAWSPAGINYAIRQMSQAGARGLTGSAAIRAIVTKFERPADPQSSIQAAIARYGQIAGGGGAAPVGAMPEAPAAAPMRPDTNPLAMALLARVRGGQDKPSIMELVQAAQQGQAMAAPAAPMTAPGQANPARAAGLRPGGGWGGSKALTDPAAQIARRFGAPITSTKRDTKLTASGNISDHWKGNRNAYATDIGATGKKGDQIARQIARRYGMAYTPGQWSSKTIRVNGVSYRLQLGWKTPGHHDHVHFGVRRL